MIPVKTIITLTFWIAITGAPAGLLIPRPNMTPAISLPLWMLFWGVVLTAVCRPAVTRLHTWLKNVLNIYHVMNAVSPSSKEEAEALGISSPLDYCIYMAANQVTPIFYIDGHNDYYAVTDGDYGPTKNKMFRTLFGRYPKTIYSSSKNYYLLTAQDKKNVECDNMEDFWQMCVLPEAADLAHVSPSEITPEIVKELASPSMRDILDQLGEVIVLSFSRNEQASSYAEAS